MKLTAIIPTRGRPHMLAGCLHTFANLQSRKHHVQYAVAVDVDDPETIVAAKELQKRYPTLSVTIFNRPPSLGEYSNRIAERVPADAYCTICDDVVCVSSKWDDAIAKELEATPKGIWWFKSDPERPVTNVIMSHAWYKAQGRIYTELFPYWYDDMWIREVVVMATGKDVPQVEGAGIVDIPMGTTRMRDLLFWDDFFQISRPGRVAQARKIAEALGYDVTVAAKIAPVFHPNHEFRKRADDVVNIQGDKKPASPEYMIAKARAEKMLARIGMLQASAA